MYWPPRNDVHSLIIGSNSVINNRLLIYCIRPKIPPTNIADGIGSYGGRHEMYMPWYERVC